MTPLLDRLLDLLASWYAYLVPWAILRDDQVGLVLRLGRVRRTMVKGWNWKWPIIESVMIETSALDSIVLREQSLTTRDGVAVTVRGVITYRVVDPQRYIIDVDNPLTVINDAVTIAIGELVPELDAPEVLQGGGFQSSLTRRVRARAKQWGIEVQSVGLADRTRARALRLMGIQST
jgi:regulator of protease activity HflC (stomatin/prohibitin superfamily)